MASPGCSIRVSQAIITLLNKSVKITTTEPAERFSPSVRSVGCGSYCSLFDGDEEEAVGLAVADALSDDLA